MKILLSLIFIFFSSYAVSAGTDSGESSSSYSDSNVDTSLEFNKAKKLIYKNRFKLALDILKSIEKETPSGYSKADLYNYLGFASRKQNNPNYKDAEKYYLKALSFDSNHIGAMEYLGELYVETDRIDQAKSMLQRLGMVAGQDSKEYKELNNLIN